MTDAREIQPRKEKHHHFSPWHATSFQPYLRNMRAAAQKAQTCQGPSSLKDIQSLGHIFKTFSILKCGSFL